MGEWMVAEMEQNLDDKMDNSPVVGSVGMLVIEKVSQKVEKTDILWAGHWANDLVTRSVVSTGLMLVCSTVGQLEHETGGY